MALTVEVVVAGSGKQITNADIDELAFEASAEDAQAENDARAGNAKLLIVNWEQVSAVIVDDTP